MEMDCAQTCLAVAAKAPAKLNMLVFKASFTKTNEKMREMRKLTKSKHLRDEMLKESGVTEAVLVAESATTEDIYLFGNKKGAEGFNVESHGWGSLRCYVGERSRAKVAAVLAMHKPKTQHA